MILNNIKEKNEKSIGINVYSLFLQQQHCSKGIKVEPLKTQLALKSAETVEAAIMQGVLIEAGTCKSFR